jgi:hypothetical protein
MSTENLNFKVFNISSALNGLSERDKKLRATNPTTLLYLEDVCRLIEIKTSNIELQNVLKEEAKKIPYKALPKFVSRLDHLVGLRLSQMNVEKYTSDNLNPVKANEEAPITSEDLVSIQDNLYNSMNHNGDEDAKQSVEQPVQEETNNNSE